GYGRDAAVTPSARRSESTEGSLTSGDGAATAAPSGNDAGSAGSGGLSGISETRDTATSSPPERTSSDDEELVCSPATEEGCEGDKPWCLGNGARGADGMLLVEPQCVECESDEHCAWPYVSEEESGACLEHECVPCELGT